MIRSIRLQNFKAIRDVEVSLERLTVFVGPNGSGKTTLIQGLDLLTNRLGREVFSPLRDYPHLEDYFSHDLNSDGFRLSCVRDEYIYRATCGKTNKWPEWQIKGRFESEADWRQPEEQDKQIFPMYYCQIFRFNPDEMGKPCIAEPINSLDSSGRWLVNTLYQLTKTQPANFRQLVQALHQIIPSAQDIRFRTAKRFISTDEFGRELGEPTEKLEVSAFLMSTNDREIPLYATSEGTLFVIGLLAVLLNDSKPRLIIIEDLDRGLHPLAQRNVVRLLRSVMDQHPDLQIVATTHSPYLLDCLRPEEVRMTTLNDDGSVACGRLVDHPKFEQWKKEMAPGEMWSMFGEKWVSESPKQPAESV